MKIVATETIVDKICNQNERENKRNGVGIHKQTFSFNSWKRKRTLLTLGELIVRVIAR